MSNATNGGASPTCPVLQYNGYTYWAWSDNQNAVAMVIVAYDSRPAVPYSPAACR